MSRENQETYIKTARDNLSFGIQFTRMQGLPSGSIVSTFDLERYTQDRYHEKIKQFFFLLVATLGSWSCSKTLTATFESDPVGGLPSKDLVGAPSGDVLEYHDGLQPSLRVQKDSALSGSKALHFARIPVDTPDSSR